MQVINISEDIITPVLYGMNNDTLNEYYRNKLSNTPVNTNSYIYETYQEQSNKFTEDYINNLKATLFDLKLVGNDDYTLYYYEDPRDANLATIQWIMSNKKISSLYERGLINGYSSTPYKHNSYQAEVNYMSVMDGYIDDDTDGFVEYYNADMFEVSRMERKLITENWRNALKHYINNIDPTDV